MLFPVSKKSTGSKNKITGIAMRPVIFMYFQIFFKLNRFGIAAINGLEVSCNDPDEINQSPDTTCAGC